MCVWPEHTQWGAIGVGQLQLETTQAAGDVDAAPAPPPDTARASGSVKGTGGFGSAFMVNSLQSGVGWIGRPGQAATPAARQSTNRKRTLSCYRNIRERYVTKQVHTEFFW